MQSVTYGDVTLQQMFTIIKDYISREHNQQYNIIVGTDSQNYDLTKTVIVVAVCRVGKGGIFFYDIKNAKRITSIRQKLFYETSLSLHLALQLTELLEKEKMPYKIGIHVDAGYKGPTSQIIPEITSWVHSCGFECQVKPDSYAASCIANRFTK